MLSSQASYEKFGKRATEIWDSITEILKIIHRTESPELATILKQVNSLPHAERMKSEDMLMLNRIEWNRKEIELQLEEIEATVLRIKQYAHQKNYFIQRAYLKLGTALLEVRYMNIQLIITKIQARIHRRVDRIPEIHS